MKLGLRFAPCLADIVNGKIKVEEVSFIMVNYYFSWNSQPSDFNVLLKNPTLSNLDKDILYEVIDNLEFTGKIVKKTNTEINYTWLEFVERNGDWAELIVSPNLSTPAVKHAWDQYQLVAGLCK